MRVLLTANASYAPPRGGSTYSNLVWLSKLSADGHECRVLAAGGSEERPDRVTIRGVQDLSRDAAVLREEIEGFNPDWVLVSSEDVAHTLLRQAHRAAPDKLVYLAHTPQWYPFGPASWHPDSAAADIVRQSRGVVAIGRTTARYIDEHCGVRAAVLHPPIYGTGPWPRFGGHDYVLMINPCVVKGISIFLEMARRFPHVQFAGLAGWGTTSEDRRAMKSLPNVRILERVPNIEEALRRARLLLMPSLWFEGFGLIAMEAMLRGLPVIASDSGGLVEAKAGTGYVIPVRPIERFEAVFDEAHMPRPVDVPQDYGPWQDALNTLLNDKDEYRREGERSRRAAEAFVSTLDAADFGRFLASLTRAEAAPEQAAQKRSLSAAQRELLLKRMRERIRT